MAEVNAAPLGLMAFGLTTVLFNLYNLGFIPLSSMILGMGIFYGGLAQLVTGLIEAKKGNTFRTVIFCSYSSFWFSFAALLLFPKLGVVAADQHSIGAYLFMWGIFTALMFVGSLRMERSTQIIFFTLTVVFFLLAAAQFTGMVSLMRVAGIVGILCGLSAIYAATGQILNEVFGQEVLPL